MSRKEPKPARGRPPRPMPEPFQLRRKRWLGYLCRVLPRRNGGTSKRAAPSPSR